MRLIMTWSLMVKYNLGSLLFLDLLHIFLGTTACFIEALHFVNHLNTSHLRKTTLKPYCIRSRCSHRCPWGAFCTQIGAIQPRVSLDLVLRINGQTRTLTLIRLHKFWCASDRIVLMPSRLYGEQYCRLHHFRRWRVWCWLCQVLFCRWRNARKVH